MYNQHQLRTYILKIMYPCNRLKINKEQDAVYQCMRHCVKTIFRENFDSAFEHLGKVDGQVTLFNLRNLLFGRYVQPDDASNPFVEVTGFDQVEKVVNTKVRTLIL